MQCNHCNTKHKIHKKYWHSFTKSIDNLIDAVEVAFENINVEKYDNVFWNLKTCMENVVWQRTCTK